MTSIVRLLLPGLILFLCASVLHAQSTGNAPVAPAGELPAAGFRFRASSLKVDIRDRAAVVRFYQNEYKKSSGVPNGWNGSPRSCRGSNSDAYREATRRRVNYFRAMAGLKADVTFKSGYNRDAQAAAVMMSANNSLSHGPPPSWKCYSASGKKGASRSNLSLGAAGPNAIDLYMWDPGAHNKRVGHRTWILNPGLAVAGSGSTKNANALYVIGEFNKNAPRPDFIAWPPPGFVPYQFGHNDKYRWSFQTKGTSLQNARVEVFANGRPLRTRVEHKTKNLLVWLVSTRGGKVSSDTRYDVKVKAGGRTYEYPVVFIDPEVAGSGQIDGPGGSEIDNNTDPGPDETATVNEPNRPQPSPARLKILNKQLVGAVYRGQLAIARKALQEGASPDAARKDWTALLLAAYYGRTQIAKLLLERGADTSRQVQGFDAVHLARARGHKRIARMVERRAGRKNRSVDVRSRGSLPPVPPR